MEGQGLPAPTTGRATGSTSPMIPVSELATPVKLVTNAVDTLSICVSPFFCALRFFDYISTRKRKRKGKQ